MFRKQLLNTYTSLGIFCIINLLFIVKYFSRIGWLPAAGFVVVYTVFCCALIPNINKIPEKFLSRQNAFLLVGLVVLASLAAFVLVKPEAVRVDRWSVITSFLDNLFAGKYPYGAKSFQGNSPGPFPFYYIITLPFYLVNEIGLLTLAALVLFFMFINKQSKDKRVFFTQTVLLVTSPAIVWEIIVRSTIFVNFCLVIFYAFWLERSVLCKDRKRLALPGLIGGLVLSTRAIVTIPIVCYLSYALLRKKEIAGYLRICAAIAAGFCMTFVPLLFYGWDSFFVQNPIVLQAGFSPPAATVCFLFISFSGGLFLKNFTGWLHFCGVIVFLIIATLMVLSLLNAGLNRSLFLSEFDISYFIFCIPFLIASINDLGFSAHQVAGNATITGCTRQ